VTDLAKVRRRLAECQGRDVTDGRPRFLFRGQRAIYPSIKSTFSRIPTDDTEIGQAYTVYRYAKQICQGLRGYTIDHLDGVAVLQLESGRLPPMRESSTSWVHRSARLWRPTSSQSLTVTGLNWPTSSPQRETQYRSTFRVCSSSSATISLRGLSRRSSATLSRGCGMQPPPNNGMQPTPQSGAADAERSAS
jgi:hypothetical protein